MVKRARAQSIVELVAGLIVLIPIVLIMIDIGSLYLASIMNSDICREAARAAANGPPGAVQTGEPQKRVDTVINRKRAMCAGNVTIDSPVQVTEAVRTPLPAKPFGGQVDGEVTVETVVTVRPPFLVQAIVPQGVKIRTSQTFPYTWVMAADDLVGANPTGQQGLPSGPASPAPTTGGVKPTSGGNPVAPTTGGDPYADTYSTGGGTK